MNPMRNPAYSGLGSVGVKTKEYAKRDIVQRTTPLIISKSCQAGRHQRSCWNARCACDCHKAGA